MKTFVGFLGVAALAAFWRPADAQTAAAPAPPAPAATAAAQPTSPAAQAALTALQRVCLPVLEGQKLDAVARSAGLKDKNDQWLLPISGKQDVTFSPPDQANPHVCTATVPYQPGAGPAILGAVRNWAMSQAPPLQPDKVAVTSTQGSTQVVTSSWTGTGPKGAEAVVLDERTPGSGGLDQATLLVSLTPS